ncbi:unnamed protein product [Spirodela intermedia]|uniref:Carbohydrate kinase PfkB domain-containing protein n=1 Tax=Spirodela intermedia TaxID=51605 RepID=A0A7I8JIT0_SPIIN|nr:unnamed protein product [Spirodela intermedia]CAA6669675.1 unnamed protein product [Spirodela intermedia]
MEQRTEFLRWGRQFLREDEKKEPVAGWQEDSRVSSCGVAGSLGGGLADGSSILGEEEEDEVEEAQEDDEALESSFSPERWDVLGLGQAMVDFSGMVDDGFLQRLGIEKGTRKVVNHEERGRVLQAMDGCSYKAAAGGSLSNTLVALSRLGRHSIGGRDLKVAMAGSVGSDPFGGFYSECEFPLGAGQGWTTGTVIVLTTPDAQRTMLAYQGTSSTVLYDSSLASLISKTNILVACEVARESGALVAVTASDVSCIRRCFDHFWEIIGGYADIVFANSAEARAFCEFSPAESPVAAARYLSHFVPLVSVTDGPQGSYIGLKGEAIYIPPTACSPVDTCGAGDAYASGILYGVLRGTSDLKSMGMLASRVASIVVAQQGTRLRSTTQGSSPPPSPTASSAPVSTPTRARTSLRFSLLFSSLSLSLSLSIILLVPLILVPKSVQRTFYR